MRWQWLAYSPSLDGAFCKVCFLFAPEVGGGRGHQRLGRLVLTKYDKWKDAVEDFSAHEATDYHKSCAAAADGFLSVVDNKQECVTSQLDLARKAQAGENRRKIRPIIETVLFCGRQGLALRGHRDSGRIDTFDMVSQNEGNFRALLRYRADAGDTGLADHLLNSSSNAVYISPTIQNEIIATCNNLVLGDIVSQVNAAQCFSLLADETTDISGTEQLSLCVRFVDAAAGQVKEDFLQFVPIFDVTGKGLATVIENSMTKFGLNVQYLRGQGYDGAAAMSGHVKGVQTYIRQLHPLAFYVHCSSHSLNLAISDACNITAVRNCMGTIGAVHKFLNTPKRNHVLQQSVESLLPSASRNRLKQMCPTRWVERHDSIHVFKELLKPVDDCLRAISVWPDKESSAGANQLLCSVRQPEFVITLHVVARIFAFSLPLCKALQKENIDLQSALHTAAEVELLVKRMRDQADTEFHDLFKSASDVCTDMDVNIIVPRLARRQTNRCNIETDDPEVYFRAAIFVPFLDNFIMQLNERFLAHKQLLGSFACLLPKTGTDSPNRDQTQGMQYLSELYNSDINCSTDVALCELEMWYSHLAALDKRPLSAIDAFCICDGERLPAIKRLLQIMATLPVTTCTSERSFSTLRRLKTYLRNTTNEERLNGLALLNVHRDCKIDPERVIDELCAKPRRLPFLLS